MAFIGKNPKWNTSTFTPQSTEPANPVEGMAYYDDGTNRPEGLYVYKNSVWTQAGGDAGIRNFDSKGDADIALTSDFTASGLTFSLSTTSADLIDGQQVFKAVAASASQTVESDSGNIPVPQGFRGRTLKINLQYKGNSSDWNLTIKDKTNTVDLTTRLVSAAGGSNNVAKDLFILFHCPSDCEQLSYQWSSTAADTIIWDEVIVNDDVFKQSSTTKRQRIYHQAVQSGMTDRTAGSIRPDIANVNTEGDSILSFENNGTSNRFRVTAIEDCYVDYSVSGRHSSSGHCRIYKNGTTTGTNDIYRSTFGTHTEASVGTRLEKDDYLEFDFNADLNNSADLFHIEITAEANVNATTDTTTDVENTFSARITNDGATADIADESSTFISSVSRTGTGVIDITFVSGLFSQIPAVFAVPDRSGADGGLRVCVPSDITTSGCTIRQINGSDLTQDADFQFLVMRQGTDYKDPSKAIVRPTSLKAFLKDKKASAASSGSVTANTVHTRVINTLEGDSSFISLSSNQFTLDPGVYNVEFESLVYNINENQMFIYNVTDATYDIDGRSVYANSSSASSVYASVEGRIEITERKTFEVRHWSSSTLASNAFGLPADVDASNPQSNEVYLIGVIEKVL